MVVGVQLAVPGPAMPCLQSSESSLFCGTEKQVVPLSSVLKRQRRAVGVTGGHLCAHKMTNSCRGKLVQETGTVTCTVCALLSPLPGDDPVGFLMNKDSFLCKPPEDVSRSAIQSCERTMVTGYNTWTDKDLRPLWFLY